MIKKRFYSVLVLSIFLLTFLTSISMVSAAEGDSYDSFDAMPNHRWVNETTTTNTEENLDYGYTAYTSSMTDDETGDYAKSRKLLTRDTYFETRFQTSSTNDSYLEFFSDTQNDTCDFYEDTDDWSGAYVDYITNGDFQSDTADRKFYDEAADNTSTGWDYSLGFVIDEAEGWLEQDGSDKFMRIDLSSGTTTNSFSQLEIPFEVDEDKSYQLTTSLRTNWIAGYAATLRMATTFQFFDISKDSLGVASFYLKKGFNPSNSSGTVYYWLDEIDAGYDTGWVNVDMDLYDVFNDIPNLDAAGERAEIKYVSIYEVAITTATGVINADLYYDDTQITESGEIISASDSILSFETTIQYDIDANYSTYDLLEFRARSSEATTLNWTLDADVDATNSTAITTSWSNYAIDVVYNMSNQLTDLTLFCENTGTTTVYFDWIALWGDLDWNNTEGVFTAGTAEIPGYWTNTTAGFDHEFTVNGDFEADAPANYYYGGAEQSGGITGWEWYAGFESTDSVGAIKVGAPDGSRMFQHDKVDATIGMDLLDAPEDFRTGGRMDFDWVEGDDYYYNISVRYDDTDAAAVDMWAAFYMTFYDGAVFHSRLYVEVRNADSGHTNSSGTLYLYTQIANGGDTGWVHYNLNMTEIFDLIPNADTQAERENIDGVVMQYTARADNYAQATWQFQADNVILYNMTDESNVWTPTVPAVAGHWNYTYSASNFTEWTISGSKFAWLTDDGSEGAYIKFYNFDNMFTSYATYQMQAIFNDRLGLPFYNYTGSFYYNPREYLRLEFEMNLDAMEISLKLEYDNGSDIFDLDIFDFTTPTSQVPLLFEESGLPTFCINNTVPANAHSFIRIDFIDTDWHPRAFTQPDDFFHQSDAQTYSNSEDSEWDSVSPYGVYSKGSEDDITRIFQLNVDNFDGLSFDFSLEYINWDAGDEGFFYIYVQGVERDGSLTTYGRVGVDVYDSGSMDVIFNFPGTGGASSFGYSTDVSGEISFDFTPDKIFSVTGSFDGSGGTEHRHELSRDPDPDNTGEFIFTFMYHLDNDEGSSTDDELDWEITNFNLVQRLIGTLLAGAAIVVGFFFLATFALLLWNNVISPVLDGIFKEGGLLSKIFDTITDIIGDVPILGDMLDFLDDLASDLGSFLTDLWAEIQEKVIDPIVDTFVDFLQDFVEEFLGFIGSLAEMTVDNIAIVIFWLWNSLFGGEESAPDLLELASMLLDGLVLFVTLLIEILTWVLEMLAFLGTGTWFLWLLVWAWLVLLTALQTSGSSAAIQWIEGMQEKAMKNVSPGSISMPFPVIGPIPIIPANIPLIVILLIGTAVELGYWDTLIGWVAP